MQVSVMGRKCFAPNCNSGYQTCKESVSLFKAPSDPERLELCRWAIPQADRCLWQEENVRKKNFLPKSLLRRTGWKVASQHSKTSSVVGKHSGVQFPWAFATFLAFNHGAEKAAKENIRSDHRRNKTKAVCSVKKRRAIQESPAQTTDSDLLKRGESQGKVQAPGLQRTVTLTECADSSGALPEDYET